MATLITAASITREMVDIDTALRDITLTQTGALVADGVTLQALYSYLKKSWRVQNFTIGAAASSPGAILNLDTAAGAGGEEVLPGMAVSTTGGQGVLAADATVVSFSGSTLTLSAGAITTAFDGSETVTFTNHLIEYPFPLVAITPEQFEFLFDWTLFDDNSRKLIRTAGWREVPTVGTATQEWVGVISLGNIDGTQTGGGDTAYYAFRANGQINYEAKSDFTYAGPVNEPVKTFGDVNNGNFDARQKELALFIRVDQKTFGKSDTVSIGVSSGSTINYQVFRFPLSENTDISWTVPAATINGLTGADEKYGSSTIGSIGPAINYLAADVNSNTLFAIDLNITRPFGITIDARSGAVGNPRLTLPEVYSWVKTQLLKNTNIDSEAVAEGTDQIGSTSDELLQFVGSELQSRLAENADNATSPSGVAVINFASTDIGNLAFAYTGAGVGDLEKFPTIAGGTITFNENLVDDADGRFTMYYTYTRQYSVSDLIWTQVSNSTGTLSRSTGDLLPVTTTGDYIDISGFTTNPNLNGVYEITNAASTSSIDVTRIDDLALPATETQSGGANNFRFNPVNSPDAIVVTAASVPTPLGPIQGLVSSATIAFDYAYTSDLTPNSANTVENRESNKNVPITIRAVGLDRAQWVSVDYSINSTQSNSFSVTAPLERNYAA